MSHVAHERARLKIRNRPMAVDKTKKHMFIPKKCAKGCCHSTVSTKNHVQQNCVHVSIWWLEHVPANVPFLSSLHLQKTFAFCPKNPSVYYSHFDGMCSLFGACCPQQIKGPDNPTCQLLPNSSQRKAKMGWERQERGKRW
jgi:hypothetical protein